MQTPAQRRASQLGSSGRPGPTVLDTTCTCWSTVAGTAGRKGAQHTNLVVAAGEPSALSPPNEGVPSDFSPSWLLLLAA